MLGFGPGESPALETVIVFDADLSFDWLVSIQKCVF